METISFPGRELDGAFPYTPPRFFHESQVGLKQFVSQIDGTVAKPDANSKSSDSKASSTSKGGLYVGKGRYLPYDPKSNESRIAKSTGRDSSLVGGFAGGEVGLRKYVETGEVPFASEGSRARRQQSSLIVAGVVSAAAVTGGILLTDVTDIGEQIVSGSTSVTPAALAGLDDNTKLLLETAILLVGVVATVVGARAIIGSITNNLREGATRLGTLALFWIVVFIAARFILDSP